MAITSVGYDGVIDEKQFESILGYTAHSSYGVNSAAAFAASTVAGQVLQVRLAAGTAWTAGLVDVMDASATVQLAAPPASGSRWDLIVLRRDYQPPAGTTSLVVIKGGSAKALPSRQTNSGVLSDQPLWLCRVDAGKSTVMEYVDLRVWARSGGCTANHDLVRSYMNTTGTMIEIKGILWLCRAGANSASEWVKPIELAMDAASTDSATPNTNVKRNPSGNAAFKSLWLQGPQSGAVDAATRRDFVVKLVADAKKDLGAIITKVKDDLGVSITKVKGDLEFEIQDHGHRNLYDPVSKASLVLSGSQADPYLECEPVYKRTYSAASNVYVTSNGIVGRSTASSSLREYKENIVAADIDPADVLALEPVTYDRRDGSGSQELGLIADDTATRVPQLALNEDGRLEGVRYDRLAVAQQVVLRDQAKRIRSLEEQMARVLAHLEEQAR